jgi:hypothetical protein
MCFSQGQSAAFAGIGLLTAALMHVCGRPRKYVVLPAYLALMVRAVQHLYDGVSYGRKMKAHRDWMKTVQGIRQILAARSK